MRSIRRTLFALVAEVARTSARLRGVEGRQAEVDPAADEAEDRLQLRDVHRQRAAQLLAQAHRQRRLRASHHSRSGGPMDAVTRGEPVDTEPFDQVATEEPPVPLTQVL